MLNTVIVVALASMVVWLSYKNLTLHFEKKKALLDAENAKLELLAYLQAQESQMADWVKRLNDVCDSYKPNPNVELTQFNSSGFYN